MQRMGKGYSLTEQNLRRHAHKLVSPQVTDLIDIAVCGEPGYIDDRETVACEMRRLQEVTKGKGDPRRFVRGHDIAPLLITLLHLGNRWADIEVVEGSLMGNIDRGYLRQQPLFQKLEARLPA